MTPAEKEPNIIVALDFASDTPALELVDRLDSRLCRLKVGKEMFTRFGPDFVGKLADKGFDVFLDLKFHDIPNTVAAACAAAADMGVWMVNVHASGGSRMLAAARERLERCSHRPLLIAVTVLTSMGPEDLAEVGYEGSPEENALRLATLAQRHGADGVVCSPREAPRLRSSLGTEFLLVTPGVRPGGASTDDQRRVTTPAEAIRGGADYLVIGRPITAAEDPVRALGAIRGELDEAVRA